MFTIQSIKPTASCLLLLLAFSSTSVIADSIPTTKVSLQTSKEAFEPKQTPADFSDFGGANTQEDSHEMWLALREQYFSDRPIIEEGNNRIHLKAPARAENDALVPVLIDLDKSDSNDPFKNVYLVVDVNPAPMGGIFKLATNRPMEQLKTSVRVNGYTYIRGIAETASGKLYMSKQWVKSTGAGCSAPPGLDQDAHKKRLGKMRFKQLEKKGGKRSLRLIVSHPNNTGMQRDQLTTMFIPEHYVKNVKVSFNKELVLEAETNFTMSENPNFTFTFDPEESGTLRADLLDNLDNSFSLETDIQGHRE